MAPDREAVQPDALDPHADERAVAVAGKARFTVLSPALIRLEWSQNASFEDRATQVVINWRRPVCDFDVRRDGKVLTIETHELRVQFTDDGHPFSPRNLTIRRRDWLQDRSWHPGVKARGNLRGTTRTLDKVAGAMSLEKGLISRDGWAILDDSTSLVFEPDDESGWLQPRAGTESIDWYFFGHGRDYKRALFDYTRIAGRIPMPPRFVFGAWWSRYWPYTDEELKRIAEDFDAHGVPLDVLVVDMDWHLEGWTGYTWDRGKFPDPEGFLKWCHERGLRITLNLHPAEGVTRHEAMFDEMCRAVGLDPTVVWHVPFDCADPEYMRAYFEVLHHPLEAQGVDFWWIDWQQGDASGVTGLDPLWQLNHLHWRDMERRAEETGRRPLVFSRWGGMGNHRYPIGFSGDTVSVWHSLEFQPYFTATAANVGYGYWSHDIGGHYYGPVEPELYLRWIQYGAFSPVLRTHTTKAPDAERRIWEFPEIFTAAREAFRLRYRLVPYIYTAARQAYDAGVSLCRPLYYEWPDIDDAYHRPGQYMFGDDLLVAPVTKPADPVTGRTEIDILLPPGTWRDFFTGRRQEGDRVIEREVALDEIPVHVRAGAIVPMATNIMRTDELPADPLVLRVFEGEAGEGRLYEDDGRTVEYRRGNFAITRFRQRRLDDARYAIEIDAADGTYKGMPGHRGYRMELVGFGPIESVRCDGEPLEPGIADGRDGWGADEAGVTVIQLLPRSVYTPLRLEIERRR